MFSKLKVTKATKDELRQTFLTDTGVWKGTYKRRFLAPAVPVDFDRIQMDLGASRDLAEIVFKGSLNYCKQAAGEQEKELVFKLMCDIIKLINSSEFVIFIAYNFSGSMWCLSCDFISTESHSLMVHMGDHHGRSLSNTFTVGHKQDFSEELGVQSLMTKRFEGILTKELIEIIDSGGKVKVDLESGKLRALVMIDNASCHFSIDIIELCMANSIELLTLPPT